MKRYTFLKISNFLTKILFFLCLKIMFVSCEREQTIQETSEKPNSEIFAKVNCNNDFNPDSGQEFFNTDHLNCTRPFNGSDEIEYASFMRYRNDLQGYSYASICHGLDGVRFKKDDKGDSGRRESWYYGAKLRGTLESCSPAFTLPIADDFNDRPSDDELEDLNLGKLYVFRHVDRSQLIITSVKLTGENPSGEMNYLFDNPNVWKPISLGTYKEKGLKTLAWRNERGKTDLYIHLDKVEGSLPLYRFRNDCNNGKYLHTLDSNEVSYLREEETCWVEEGLLGYAFP